MNVSRDVISEIFRMSAHEGTGRSLIASNRMTAKSLVPIGAKVTPSSHRIEATQQTLVAMRDRLKQLHNQDELDEAEQAEYQELAPKIEQTERSLAAMEAAERTLASKAGPSHALTTTTGNSLTTMPGSGPIRLPAAPKKPIENPREMLIKTMTAMFIAKSMGRSLDDVLRDRYSGESYSADVIRAISNPAMTTVALWAGELVGIAVADFVTQLPRRSIFPTLSGMGTKFTFGGNGIIKIPSRVVSGPTNKINGSFVGEGQPIPVRAGQLTSVTLTQKKMAVISTFTREMANSSTPSIESVIRQTITEDTAEAIDAALIDAVVADAIRPAGLLNGLSSQTPSAAATPFDKMVADINTLAGVITANRGGDNLLLIMNPAQERKMAWATVPNTGTFVFSSVESGRVRDMTIVASTTVPAGQLIMLDANEFASVTGDSPEFDVNDVATIHEESVPLPIVGGVVQPPVIGSIAAPVRSLWQTASMGIRMILPMNWTMRRTGMVSFMNSVTW